MTARINITLTDEDYDRLVTCYKQFINTHDWKNKPIPTVTGYVASIVNVTVDRILAEEKL